jgi:hypothetical protein
MSKPDYLFRILRKGFATVKAMPEKESRDCKTCLDCQNGKPCKNMVQIETGKTRLVCSFPVTIANPFYGNKLSTFATRPSLDFDSVESARVFCRKEKKRIGRIEKARNNPKTRGLNDRGGMAQLGKDSLPVHNVQSKGRVIVKGKTESRFAVKDNTDSKYMAESAIAIVKGNKKTLSLQSPVIRHIPFVMTKAESKGDE